MKLSTERRWVSLRSSPKWRRLTNSGPGSRILQSRAYRSIDSSRRFIQTAYTMMRDRDVFDSVETFCLFLGTVKSGGTLLGSLIDAHPDAVLADEADALRYVAARFRREQIFHILAKTSRREAMKGRITARRLEPYSLAVPGQWQGATREVRVVGDSRAGPTTRRLGSESHLLERLQHVLGDVEDRYIHVVRNPFDPIAAMRRRGRRTADNAIQDYTDQSDRMLLLRERLPADRVLTVRYEDFTSQPAEGLTSICHFLGLDVDEDYLAACVSIVDASWPQERATVDWTPESISAIEGLIDRVPFLEGYTFSE